MRVHTAPLQTLGRTALSFLAARPPFSRPSLSSSLSPQSKLLEPSKSPEKMYMVDEHVAVAVAGINADANILINQARLHAQRYRFTFQEPQPVEQLVQSLCDEKQAYTQYGGLRPFGVSMLYAGWDKTYGFQLYQSDPSGNYNGWKATCIGMNHQSATSLMKQSTRRRRYRWIRCAHRCRAQIIINSRGR